MLPPDSVGSMDEDQLIKKYLCNIFAFEKAELVFTLPFNM